MIPLGFFIANCSEIANIPLIVIAVTLPINRPCTERSFKRKTRNKYISQIIRSA